MKNNLRLLITLFFLILPACTGKGVNSFTELPLLQKAFEVKHFNDRTAKGAKSLIYKITTPFPAEEVTTFIDHDMQNKGFKRYPMPYDAVQSFSWVTFSPKTGNWEKTDKVPARYVASWTNENRNEIAWVVIEYAPYSKVENWQGTAQVSCQIANFTDFKRDTKALEKLMHNKRVQN